MQAVKGNLFKFAHLTKAMFEAQNKFISNFIHLLVLWENTVVIILGEKYAKPVKLAQCSGIPFSLLFLYPVDWKISPLFPFSQILKEVQVLSAFTNSLHCHASP